MNPPPAHLPANPSNKIKLFCWVYNYGDSNPFPVNIDLEETIADLKEAIMAKNPNSFDKVDAFRLNLFKIFKLPKEKIDRSELVDSLAAMDEIKDHFSGELPRGSIHVVVLLPQRKFPKHRFPPTYLQFPGS